jgi:hypothetical protein
MAFAPSAVYPIREGGAFIEKDHGNLFEYDLHGEDTFAGNRVSLKTRLIQDGRASQEDCCLHRHDEDESGQPEKWSGPPKL